MVDLFRSIDLKAKSIWLTSCSIPQTEFVPDSSDLAQALYGQQVCLKPMWDFKFMFQLQYQQYKYSLLSFVCDPLSNTFLA